MRISNRFHRAMAFLLTCFVFRAFSGCGSSQTHQSPQEQAEGNYWYEAVFPDREEAEKAFRTVSDHYPRYEFVPDHFHVTTQYKPEPGNEDLYGLPVTLHMIGYTSGSVQDKQESIPSDNEGLPVEISTEDEGMRHLIDSCDRIWHITGSYTVAEKYTGQLNFSDATPIDITITGVFGMADSDGNVILAPRN